jgi:limonene-1,2-epoxide hydrolase
MKASEVVAALFDASERRDLDGCLDLFTEDDVWDLVPLKAGEAREGVRKLPVPMTELLQEGDIVLHERVNRFKIDGEWREIPVADVFEIKQGKVQIWRDYFCLKTFEQLPVPIV